MENTTGNYLKNGNESVLGPQCLKTLRLQLGNLGGQQRKWLAQTQLCHPEEHNVIFSLLPPTSTRSNGKRYNCTLKNLYSATILWTKNLLLLTAQHRTGTWKFQHTEFKKSVTKPRAFTLQLSAFVFHGKYIMHLFDTAYVSELLSKRR